MANVRLEKIKKAAVEAAVEAGNYALARMGKIAEITHKRGHNDLVTDVDKHCEEIIIDRIKKDFPGHSILAEESGGNAGEKGFSWIIDPLDGTTNYAHGFPFFCASIGVVAHDAKQSAVKIGVVYDPSREELFSAEEGKGAFLNKTRINVSDSKKVRDSLIATGFAYDVTKKVRMLPYFDKVLRQAQAVRRAGSAAMDLCYVACGRFDGFWEFNLNPWDTAAGQLLVKEAGGMVTTLSGKPFGIFKKEIIATNAKIHAEILTLLTS